MTLAKQLLGALLAIAAAAAFIALGLWQLDRAEQVRESQRPYQEQPIIQLDKVAQPNTNLDANAVNRIVTFTGTYIGQLDAPQQVDSSKRLGTWQVGIMQVDGGANILVVRSLSLSDLPRGDVAVTGRLFHRQYEDKVVDIQGGLRRIDPALVIAEYGGDFYDGFVVADREVVTGQIIVADRVNLDPARPTTPGYYWQHIAYVVIWWLMALVVLFLPIYSRRNARNELGVTQKEM